jgi:signal peptidase II
MLTGAFVLCCDQLSKFAIVGSLVRGDCREVFSFFNIVRVENRGITFGLFNSASTNCWLLILLSLAIVVVLLMWARKEVEYQLSASVVIAGAIGNALDRLLHGAVIDFLDFHIGEYHWPAFNVADSAIVVAVAAMVWISFCQEEQKKLEGKEELEKQKERK